MLLGVVGRDTWNRTKADEFKARCATITLCPNKIKQDAYFSIKS